MIKNSFETTFTRIALYVCPVVLAALTYLLALYELNFSFKIISFLLFGGACFLWLLPFLKRKNRPFAITLVRVTATALGYALTVYFANTFFRFCWLGQYFTKNWGLYRWILADTLQFNLWFYLIAFALAFGLCLAAMGLTSPTFLFWKKQSIRAWRKKQTRDRLQNLGFAKLYEKSQSSPFGKGELERYVTLFPRAKEELMEHIEKNKGSYYLIDLLLTHYGKQLTKEQFEHYRQQYLQRATQSHQRSIEQLKEIIAALPHKFDNLEEYFAPESNPPREKAGEEEC